MKDVVVLLLVCIYYEDNRLEVAEECEVEEIENSLGIVDYIAGQDHHLAASEVERQEED